MAVTVIDQGEGIAREHLPRLTERFYRVDTARSRELGGTGLGLAIVKHIVNRHRGLLEIDSELGKGCDFTVYLPLARGGGAGERPDRAAAAARRRPLAASQMSAAGRCISTHVMAWLLVARLSAVLSYVRRISVDQSLRLPARRRGGQGRAAWLGGSRRTFDSNKRRNPA